RAERPEICHLTVVVEERMLAAAARAGGEGIADDAPLVVDSGAVAVEAAERAEVRHLAVVVEERVLRAPERGLREPRDLTAVVDRVGEAVAAAERADVGEYAGGE